MADYIPGKDGGFGVWFSFMYRYVPQKRAGNLPAPGRFNMAGEAPNGVFRLRGGGSLEGGGTAAGAGTGVPPARIRG
jgi:hypothetical protein